MSAEDVTDALWDYGEASIGKFFGVARAAMRNPAVGLPREHQRDFGEQIEIFRARGHEDRNAVISRLQARHDELKSCRSARERDRLTGRSRRRQIRAPLQFHLDLTGDP